MGRTGGRWKHLTYFGIQKKQGAAVNCPPKNIFENHSARAMSPDTLCWSKWLVKPGPPNLQPWDWGPALRWWTWSNTLHELDKRTMRGRSRNEVRMTTKRSKTPSNAAKIIDTNLKSCKMIGRNLVQYLPHTSLNRLCCRSLDSFHQHLDVLTTT